jgi:RimJ/RimL family protein N-acetyltransferase
MSEASLFPPARIETTRLILRPYAADDGPLLLDIARRNRAHLTRYESVNILMGATTGAEASAIAQELADHWARREAFFFGAFERASGIFAAQVYVGPADPNLPEFEVGYVADVAHEGQGFVSEAVRAVIPWIFGSLGAHRLRLECDDTNLLSARVAERCGFVREGHLRQNKRHPDGTCSGTLLYGLLRAEYHS